MSGIAGLYNLDGRPVMHHHLVPMLRALTHRGPEGSGLWSEGAVGLGHRRLSTAPTKQSEHQPLVSRSGRLTLVADARIDNGAEVAQALGSREGGASISTATLLLAGYERWGRDLPRHLVGDFAFAIWDAADRSLFCARDHFGLRPLYYYRSATAFAFASEIKALLTLPEIPDTLNDLRVADFLLQAHRDPASTFFEEVHKLPPAHTLTVTPEGVRLEPYWSLDADREELRATDAEYTEAFHELFTTSVAARLRSHFPVGTLLSGGLDSSSVTGVARAQLQKGTGEPLNTFSLTFEGVPYADERPFIQSVIEGGGLRPHFIPGTQVDPLQDLDRMLWHTDEPFYTPNLFLNWRLLQTAKREGVRVLLEGFLGDNVVGHGSRRLTELATSGHWRTLAHELHAVAGHYPDRRQAAWDTLRRFVLKPLVTEPLHRAWLSLRSPDLALTARSPFIDTGFARQIDWMELAVARGEDVLPRTAVTAREEHYRELTSGLLPGALEIANKAAAAFGIALAFPFSDRRLMEFCFALPSAQKFKDGYNRTIARRALAAYLPERVRNRFGKANLAPVFHQSLLANAGPELDSLVFDRSAILAPYVNVPALHRTYRSVRDQQNFGGVLLSVWLAVVLTRWLEIRRDGARSLPATGLSANDLGLQVPSPEQQAQPLAVL